MRKIFAAMIILTVLAGVSHADIVYTTSNSELGVIPITNSTSIDVPYLAYYDVGNDPLVGSYTVGSTPYVMVVDRATGSESGDTALIFDASDLTSPKESVTLNGVYSAKRFASSRNGRSIFFASEESIAIVEFDTSSIDIPINVYMYDNISDDPEIVDMSVGSYNIYALFRAAPDKLELLAFDGQLKEGVKNFKRGTIRNDATNLAELSSNRFAVGAEGGISIASSAGISTLLSSDYPVKSICRDRGNGLYYAELSESGDVNLYHYDSDSRQAVKIDSLSGSSVCQIVRDSSNNILALLTVDGIYLYDMVEDEFLVGFNSSTLGGTPVNMAVSNPEHDKSSSSSSNCDVSGLGAMMMGVCAYVIMRRKR